MANQLVWEDRYNIGVDIIDNEHKKLFKIINKLFTISEQDNKSTWVCQEGIKYFKDHALKHFAEEEFYMESISYKELETHRRLHIDFRRNILPGLEEELVQTNYSKDAINHFLGVCVGWLLGHTLTEDRAIVGNTTSKWDNLLPEEEQQAVIQTITKLLNDIFQIESQIISNCYGGEKFGNGIYYRLVYGTDKGENQEIILVFEEKLLVNTVGKLISDHSNTLNVMQVNAARYVSRQFVESIKEHFAYAKDYKIQCENLLTYEQFQKAFDRKPPQYSFLFNTGAGYFAYCAMAPNLKQDNSIISIKSDNAIEKIEGYLKKSEQENKINSNKKKLLIVDDSITIRHAMQLLLKSDYQVSVAESGVSAIRCMTLETPDLVLLDYEMPICDGAQVLQMIRSEPEFSDVPVIFLTSKNDKESISKVIPLKPAGYFLKNVKPTEIKKNIDNYFSKKSTNA